MQRPPAPRWNRALGGACQVGTLQGPCLSLNRGVSAVAETRGSSETTIGCGHAPQAATTHRSWDMNTPGEASVPHLLTVKGVSCWHWHTCCKVPGWHVPTREPCQSDQTERSFIQRLSLSISSCLQETCQATLGADVGMILAPNLSLSISPLPLWFSGQTTRPRG